MNTTTNLGLKKPEGSDLYNVEDMNYNSDIIDALIVETTQAAYDALSTKNPKTLYVITG